MDKWYINLLIIDLIPLSQEEAYRYVLKVRRRIKFANNVVKRIYDFAYT